MNVLAVCSFDPVLEIGLFKQDGAFWLSSSRSAAQRSEKLVAGIRGIVARAGLELSDLDLLSCAGGPGSFTGLRIGMSALKGLALALDRPLVSVPTMEILADGLGFFDGAVVPVLDARKKRWYCAVFEKGRRVCPDLDIRPEELAPRLKPFGKILFTGGDAGLFAEKIASLGVLDAELATDVRIGTRCEALSRLATRRLGEVGPDDIGQGPRYVRRSDAEENLRAREADGRSNPTGEGS